MQVGKLSQKLLRMWAGKESERECRTGERSAEKRQSQQIGPQAALEPIIVALESGKPARSVELDDQVGFAAIRKFQTRMFQKDQFSNASSRAPPMAERGWEGWHGLGGSLRGVLSWGATFGSERSSH